jgi:hypothetical protein
MTTSYVRSASFTITDARYIGAKVGADLRQLNTLYGKPTLTDIPDYVEEVALLLKNGYLDTVDYGFRDAGTNAWKLRLRYRATTGGQLVDSPPGSLPRSTDVVGLSFYSYLTYSSTFHQLTTTDQGQFKQTLPVQRGGAAAPSANVGTSVNGHGYARGGTGVARDVYTAF